MIEELHKQIIAIQIIQELIVDIMDENDIIDRSEFEERLKSRVESLNKQLEILNSQVKEEKKYQMNNWFNNPIGEA
jgi:polyhydroxyalkanoate synthesis regulator phasin